MNMGRSLGNLVSIQGSKTRKPKNYLVRKRRKGGGPLNKGEEAKGLDLDDKSRDNRGGAYRSQNPQPNDYTKPRTSHPHSSREKRRVVSHNEEKPS